MGYIDANYVQMSIHCVQTGVSFMHYVTSIVLDCEHVREPEFVRMASVHI